MIFFPYNFIFLAVNGLFVRRSGTFCAILVDGIMGNIHVKLFKLNLEQWLRRRCRLKKMFNGALLMTNGRRPTTIAHLEPVLIKR